MADALTSVISQFSDADFVLLITAASLKMQKRTAEIDADELSAGLERSGVGEDDQRAVLKAAGALLKGAGKQAGHKGRHLSTL